MTIDRVTCAVGIRIDPTLAKRTQTVRAVEADACSRRTMTEGDISDAIKLSRLQLCQQATLVVGGAQDCAAWLRLGAMRFMGRLRSGAGQRHA